MERNKVYLGDCLELMPKYIDDKSIDMIFCDLPYGITACKWDTIIPLDKLWAEYKRIIKNNGAIVLFSAQPFTSALVMSNPKLFKYEWVWEKDRPSNPLVSNKRVMPRHENICIFYKKQPIYNPQKELRKENNKRNNKKNTLHNTGTKVGAMYRGGGNTDWVHPTSIQKFTTGKRGFHPTQKPIALIEYMIKTYTNEGDLILDNCCGSGTTGVGAINLERDFIMMEQDFEYYEIACNRVSQQIDSILG